MHIEADKCFYKLVEIICGRKYSSIVKSISNAVNIINPLLLYKQVRVWDSCGQVIEKQFQLQCFSFSGGWFLSAKEKL